MTTVRVLVTLLFLVILVSETTSSPIKGKDEVLKPEASRFLRIKSVSSAHYPSSSSFSSKESYPDPNAPVARFDSSLRPPTEVQPDQDQITHGKDDGFSSSERTALDKVFQPASGKTNRQQFQTTTSAPAAQTTPSLTVSNFGDRIQKNDGGSNSPRCSAKGGCTVMTFKSRAGASVGDSVSGVDKFQGTPAQSATDSPYDQKQQYAATLEPSEIFKIQDDYDIPTVNENFPDYEGLLSSQGASDVTQGEIPLLQDGKGFPGDENKESVANQVPVPTDFDYSGYVSEHSADSFPVQKEEDAHIEHGRFSPSSPDFVQEQNYENRDANQEVKHDGSSQQDFDARTQDSQSFEHHQQLDAHQNGPFDDSQQSIDDGQYYHHGDPIDWLRYSVPGNPGEDYPILYQVPQTSFNCQQQPFSAGIFGDMEASCQVFHVCKENGGQDSFLCPNGTVFNQQYFVCDWWYNFKCSDTPSFYNLNADLYWDWDSFTPSQVLNVPPSSGDEIHSNLHSGSQGAFSTITGNEFKNTAEDKTLGHGDSVKSTIAIDNSAIFDNNRRIHEQTPDEHVFTEEKSGTSNEFQHSQQDSQQQQLQEIVPSFGNEFTDTATISPSIGESVEHVPGHSSFETSFNRQNENSFNPTASDTGANRQPSVDAGTRYPDQTGYTQQSNNFQSRDRDGLNQFDISQEIVSDTGANGQTSVDAGTRYPDENGYMQQSNNFQSRDQDGLSQFDFNQEIISDTGANTETSVDAGAGYSDQNGYQSNNFQSQDQNGYQSNGFQSQDQNGYQSNGFQSQDQNGYQSNGFQSQDQNGHQSNGFQSQDQNGYQSNGFQSQDQNGYQSNGFQSQDQNGYQSNGFQSQDQNGLSQFDVSQEIVPDARRSDEIPHAGTQGQSSDSFKGSSGQSFNQNQQDNINYQPESFVNSQNQGPSEFFSNERSKTEGQDVHQQHTSIPSSGTQSTVLNTRDQSFNQQTVNTENQRPSIDSNQSFLRDTHVNNQDSHGNSEVQQEHIYTSFDRNREDSRTFNFQNQDDRTTPFSMDLNTFGNSGSTVNPDNQENQFQQEHITTSFGDQNDRNQETNVRLNNDQNEATGHFPTQEEISSGVDGANRNMEVYNNNQGFDSQTETPTVPQINIVDSSSFGNEDTQNFGFNGGLQQEHIPAFDDVSPNEPSVNEKPNSETRDRGYPGQMTTSFEQSGQNVFQNENTRQDQNVRGNEEVKQDHISVPFNEQKPNSFDNNRNQNVQGEFPFDFRRENNQINNMGVSFENRNNLDRNNYPVIEQVHISNQFEDNRHIDHNVHQDGGHDRRQNNGSPDSHHDVKPENFEQKNVPVMLVENRPNHFEPVGNRNYNQDQNNPNQQIPFGTNAGNAGNNPVLQQQYIQTSFDGRGPNAFGSSENDGGRIMQNGYANLDQGLGLNGNQQNNFRPVYNGNQQAFQQNLRQEQVPVPFGGNQQNRFNVENSFGQQNHRVVQEPSQNGLQPPFERNPGANQNANAAFQLRLNNFQPGNIHMMNRGGVQTVKNQEQRFSFRPYGQNEPNIIQFPGNVPITFIQSQHNDASSDYNGPSNQNFFVTNGHQVRDEQYQQTANKPFSDQRPQNDVQNNRQYDNQQYTQGEFNRGSTTDRGINNDNEVRNTNINTSVPPFSEDRNQNINYRIKGLSPENYNRERSIDFSSPSSTEMNPRVFPTVAIKADDVVTYNQPESPSSMSYNGWKPVVKH